MSAEFRSAPHESAHTTMDISSGADRWCFQAPREADWRRKSLGSVRSFPSSVPQNPGLARLSYPGRAGLPRSPVQSAHLHRHPPWRESDRPVLRHCLPELTKTCSRAFVFVVRLRKASWFLEVQHQMSRSTGSGIGGGGEGGFVGCYERETGHGSVRVNLVDACANGIVDRFAGAVGAGDLCEFEFEDFGGHVFLASRSFRSLVNKFGVWFGLVDLVIVRFRFLGGFRR